MTRSYLCPDGSEVVVADKGKWVTFGIAAPDGDGDSALFMLRAPAGKSLEALLKRNAEKKAKRG